MAIAETNTHLDPISARLRELAIKNQDPNETFETPSTFIKIGDDLSSKQVGFEAYAPVFFYDLKVSRRTPRTVDGANNSNATVIFQTLKVILMDDIWTSKLLDKLSKNACIDEVIMVQLIDANDPNQVKSTFTWNTSNVREIRLMGGFVLISLDFNKFAGEHSQFGQDNASGGKAAFKFNVTTAAPE